MLDCAIRGGLVVDGTGRRAFRADIGIRNGRIVEVGALEESARRVIDAAGRVVAPGFIDVHTHYDAQVMWDPALAVSSLHGVTTIVGGNCGFTIAPVSDESADYVMRMLACVEEIPAKALEGVLDFRWSTFGEWLARLDGALAVNAGFLVGHSTVRRLVMGDDHQERATEAQIQEMARLVDASVREGALGFSSSWGTFHRDHLGNPVPSRSAATEELVALASVLRSHPGTMLEFIPPYALEWPEEVADAMVAMSVEAQRPLNWNLLTIGPGHDRASNDNLVGLADRAAAQGGKIVALTLPVPTQLRINLATTSLYNNLPAWSEVLRLPPPAMVDALSDARTRARMGEAADERQRARPSLNLDFEEMTVCSVRSPSLAPLKGRVVGDIARERRTSALDAFLDIAVEDDLATYFETAAIGDDDDSWRERVDYWRDPRVLMGGSDAGAHVDTISNFAFFSNFVGPIVRERHLLSLEDAVQMVTGAPAEFYGLHDRGRLQLGCRADIVVFDPETVGTGEIEIRGDMPNDERRIFAEAIGIDHVLVNGVEIVDHGRTTGSTPGSIIRSDGAADSSAR